MRKILFFINPISGTHNKLRLEKKIIKNVLNIILVLNYYLLLKMEIIPFERKNNAG